ncbi:MAG: M28 family peptidase [Bacteroidota bacterium]
MQNAFLLAATFFVGSLQMSAQVMGDEQADPPEFSLNETQLKGQMYWLASDYLAGRRTGSIGNDIAAEYIASQLQGFGYEPINDGSYFQEVPMESIQGPTRGSLKIGQTVYEHGEELLIMRGPAMGRTKAKIVYAGYGWVDEESGHDDFANIDVAGKIVITRPGVPGSPGQQGIFQGMQSKAELAAERGAVAVYEFYQLPFPWSAFKGYFGGDRLSLANDDDPGSPIPYGFLNIDEATINSITTATKTLKGETMSEGMRISPNNSRNIGGILRGSDPELADEYLIMTAHMDHVGVGEQGGGAYTPEDSIFNGARDNGIGTIALLSAARCFAEQPPRRSIIILAVTGEELGLLGSQYYAENPLVPLEQTVYNFNVDGAGYNDVNAISTFGGGRTGVEAEVQAAADLFDFTIYNNPAPEQGLYDRSDNVSFAQKGVPAITFTEGFADFDDEIMQYYHQVSDNPSTIDYEYLRKFCVAFTYAARLIADRDERPFWIEGDKYEEAGLELYNR